MLPETRGSVLEQTNPLAPIQALPKLGECGWRVGTAVCSACESRGAGWWGAAGAPSWGHSAAECSTPTKHHPWAAPWGYGRVILLGGRCRDHDAAQTPTPPTASQTPAPPRPLFLRDIQMRPFRAAFTELALPVSPAQTGPNFRGESSL